jgi:hypothetical protein
VSSHRARSGFVEAAADADADAPFIAFLTMEVSGREGRAPAGHPDHESPANRRNQSETSDRTWTLVLPLVFPHCSLVSVPAWTTLDVLAGCVVS